MRSTLTFLAAGLLAVIGGTAQADMALPVDGQWHPFSWYDAPGAWWEGGPFTYNVPDLTYLKVTDSYIDGDRFEVYDWGSLIGRTSAPTNSTSFTIDPGSAFADTRWSSGKFFMAPGAHSLTLQTIAIPTGGAFGTWTYGTGYLQVQAAASSGQVQGVPVPGAALLGALGLSVAGWRLRRRAV